MTIQKTFLCLNKLFVKGAFLTFLVMATTACLAPDLVSKKSQVVKIVLDGEEDATIIDFGNTVIGNNQITTKTFRLTNLSTHAAHINFSIPQGYNIVNSGSAKGKECDDRATMFVQGKEICYFAIEFRPTIRLTHDDNAPFDIVVDQNGKVYNYNGIFTLQGIARNSKTITFAKNLDFGITAKNSSKISSTTLHNTTTESIYYDITLPKNITIDPTSICKQSGLLDDESSCEILFRYSSATTTGNINDIITLTQDRGAENITASMDVKNSAIANIVAPASRYDASMITFGTTEATGILKLIGGRNGTNTATDIWTFDILKKTWTLNASEPFSYIDNDNTSQEIKVLYNRVAVVGGKQLILPNPITNANKFDNKSFILNDNSTVTLLDNDTPNARNNYKIATNPITRKVYVYGGNFDNGTLSDNLSLVLDNGSFDNITTINNPDRHLAGFTSTNNDLYLFGGSTLDNTTSMSKSLFEYNNQTKTWTDIYDLSQDNNILFNNNSAEMVYLNNGDKALYVFGGKFEDEVSKDNQSALYKLELENNNWSKLTDKVMPPARTKHNLVQFMNTYIYLFGGLNSDNKSTNDLWVFDTTINKWEKINLPLLEQKLDNHAVTTSKDGRYIYIYGGQTADGTASTKFMVYDTELNYFQELATIGNGAEFARFGHQLVSAKDGNVILLIGGSEDLDGVPTDKHYQYNIKENKWTQLQVTGDTADITVTDHTAVNKDGTIYIIGGRATNLATGTPVNKVITITFADNETDTEATVTNINKPMTTARFNHSATVVGDNIYVAGGNTDTTKTNSVEKLDLTTQVWDNVNNASVVDVTGFRNSSLVADGTTLYLIGGIGSNSDNKINTVFKLVSGGTWAEVNTGAGATLDGKVMFSGQTYFIKANNTFINFGGDVLSIIYP